MLELRFYRNVFFKASVLFLLFNLAFAAWHPMAQVGHVSLYNHGIPGRNRLPYSDNPSRAYSLSLFNFEAMFASHEIAAGSKTVDEFRVILIGDSSTWGFLLSVENTLSAYLNEAGLQASDGRKVRAYNLGYPVMSLAKDLLILSIAMRYQPDLIVWPVTLESMPYDKQLFSPLLQNNSENMRKLIQDYNLRIDPNSNEFHNSNFWSKTLIGSRRDLADIIRLQLYGVMWAATGIDQDIPEVYTPRLEDLPADESFHDLLPPQLSEADLALDILQAGLKLADGVPVLIVNEPMFISKGQNSHIRYNYFYPRWAYDQYRQMMAGFSEQQHWNYLDLWNAIPASEFTNSAVHMTPQGTKQLASMIASAILEILAATPYP